MYQVIAYERDQYDRCTLIRNHRRMGVKSFDVALKWLRQYQFAVVNKSTENGWSPVAVIKKGQVTFLS
jgi:hypothetical protein